MGWYCCHVIEVIRAKDDRRLCSIYENVILIEAGDCKEATAKGMGLAREKYEYEDESLTCDGVPAYVEVAGTRKVIRFEDHDGASLDGVEATYSQLTVDGENDLRALVDGDRVRVWYEE